MGFSMQKEHIILTKNSFVGKVEYCMTEQFKASCGHDSVIDIQSAMYGRMHIGRCVSTDYGNLGCEADVRTMTDRRCSGRHECRIDIPDRDFERTKPCPVEFIKFFEVEYKCVKGKKHTFIGFYRFSSTKT